MLTQNGKLKIRFSTEKLALNAGPYSVVVAPVFKWQLLICAYS
ncbi:hypothetical protein PRUB_a4630 [Pseudoalteromonas rubra]|uniref:Uncharacterized protein n=1 Tax=Pseudoalteromonas rubra TaxID=43658 RepID=A0A8T0C9X3_9GAMM|nr:hypothetical protein PRUB_a4630 [Pseudoalteromonas rubra]